MIAAQANVVGVAVGYFYPSVFVKESDINDAESGRRHTYTMLLIFAIAMSVVTAFTLILFRKSPKKNLLEY